MTNIQNTYLTEINKMEADLISRNCDNNIFGTNLEEYIIKTLEDAKKFVGEKNYFEAQDRIDLVKKYLLY